MIVLGIVLLIIGFIAGLSIIWMLGIIAEWCSEQLCSVDVTISEFMVEIPCDMMDSGKPCRKAIGESRAGPDSVACLCAPGDWTPSPLGGIVARARGQHHSLRHPAGIPLPHR
jgi:hypothetical protein